MASAPANAQVHIGVGIGGPDVHVGVGVGGPAPYYYGPGYYPPGPCDAYNYYYDGDCGYSVYNGPIVLGGINVGGPHYYRWYNGVPLFLVSRRLADLEWLEPRELRLGPWRRLWLAGRPLGSRLGQRPLAWRAGGFP